MCVQVMFVLIMSIRPVSGQPLPNKLPTHKFGMNSFKEGSIGILTFENFD